MKNYKSPPHKLISFFHQSRDLWKEKYMSLQDTVKYLKNRVLFLSNSKEHWKQKAKALEKELRKKEKKFAVKKEDLLYEMESLKKK